MVGSRVRSCVDVACDWHRSGPHSQRFCITGRERESWDYVDSTAIERKREAGRSQIDPKRTENNLRSTSKQTNKPPLTKWGEKRKETTTTPEWFSKPVLQKENKTKTRQQFVYLFLSVKPLAISLHHAFSIFSVSPIFLITDFSFPPTCLSFSAWHLSTRTTLKPSLDYKRRKSKKRKHRFVVVQFGREKGNKQTNKNSNFHRTHGRMDRRTKQTRKST